MKVVLLSGGSGQRLWPLSNDAYSKQYIKFVQPDPETAIWNETSENKCSMLQRVYNQLEAIGLRNENIIIAASAAQRELVEAQLPNREVQFATEPMRRDTFPAVVLASAYLATKCHAEENEVVAVLPVDPYVKLDYFRKIKELVNLIEDRIGTIGLLGALPVYPSEKYGYIRIRETEESYLHVTGFEEKPTLERASELIEQGSLWNCGIFCFSLKTAKNWVEKYELPLDYDSLVENYQNLPKISFDYEVLEHWKDIIAVSYDGMWKDIGTWNTLTEEMQEQSIGEVFLDDTCKNCHVINTLDMPLIVMGGENLVVAATYDGILVADKQQSSYLKEPLEQLSPIPRYEERRWGTIKTIDCSGEGENSICTNKVKMETGQYTTYHCHHAHREMLTILSGEGELLQGQKRVALKPGMTISIETECFHAIRAIRELRYIEILMGKLDGDDIERKHYEWIEE